jgi:hypothetical protein
MTTVVSATALATVVGSTADFAGVTALAASGEAPAFGNDEGVFVEDAVPLDWVESTFPARDVTTGFGGGKSSCETAIAISDRNRARKKRLSISGNWVVSARAERMASKESHSRQPHAFQDAIPLKRLKSVGGARWIVTATCGKKWGNRELITANQVNEHKSHRSARKLHNPAANYCNLVGQLFKAAAVCLRLRSNQKIYSCDVRQKSGTNNLTKAAFDEIPLDNLPSVLWDNDTHPWMRQQGSGCSSFQTLGLHSLPCTPYRFQIGFARKPGPARETERLRRRRISSATER